MLSYCHAFFKKHFGVPQILDSYLEDHSDHVIEELYGLLELFWLAFLFIKIYQRVGKANSVCKILLIFLSFSSDEILESTYRIQIHVIMFIVQSFYEEWSSLTVKYKFKT